MDYVRNPTWLNFLHNLQFQLFSHSLICLLNVESVLMLLSSSGRLFQSFYLKNASYPFHDQKFLFWGLQQQSVPKIVGFVLLYKNFLKMQCRRCTLQRAKMVCRLKRVNRAKLERTRKPVPVGELRGTKLRWGRE